ncbi:hypothetical protein AMATHDRAFT_46814 [Amanita thiersii Skay4041]|uniref:WD40 repeat-like protein n=1 Tax=Amanita thiersii Skay4041 TaxID=703135 RepID=A0A2A9NVX9_9AGAR|nr:hypothetical protein AMATHDRAFT_46814 [Amanita thiersii Skay4041]
MPAMDTRHADIDLTLVSSPSVIDLTGDISETSIFCDITHDSNDDEIYEYDSDPEVEYETIHGLEMDNDENWKAMLHERSEPPSPSDEKVQMEVEVVENDTRFSTQTKSNIIKYSAITRQEPVVGVVKRSHQTAVFPIPWIECQSRYKSFRYVKLCMVRVPQGSSRKRQRNTVLYSPTSLQRPTRAPGPYRLDLTTSFKRAPACIIRIIQKQDTAVISSSCPGDADDQMNGFNREGSLITWNGTENILPGHSHRAGGDTKYFSVNDVKFDPCSMSFVSSGNDKRVRVWSRDPDTDEYEQEHTLGVFRCAPFELAFKPGTSILAVAERRIHIYANYESSKLKTSLRVCPVADDHNVGSMVWGYNTTEQYLFASSEPESDDCYEGFHRAFNMEKGVCDYELDTSEAGDCMEVVPNGTCFAPSCSSRNMLRIYDIKRKNGCAIHTIRMDDFHLSSDKDGEVNTIATSPGGFYVALGRNDNRIDVYDLRMINKKKLCEYVHKGKCLTSPGFSSYGIVKVQWAEMDNSRLVLVSGGNDDKSGCVRAWDPLQADDDATNGVILAEVRSDVAYFSLGDCMQGSQQLIVYVTFSQVQEQ